METTTTIDQKRIGQNDGAITKVNGKPFSGLSQTRSFTIGNLENALREKYGEVTVTQNMWLAKVCGVYDYKLSIDIKNRETAEEVKKSMMSIFGQEPLGGHRNYQYQNPEWAINLFLYYKTEKGVFGLGFSNVLKPDSELK